MCSRKLDGSMEGMSENSSDNQVPELMNPQNSSATRSPVRMSSQQRPSPLPPRPSEHHQGAMELSQWRAHLASQTSGNNSAARINSEPTSVKLDPDGLEAQETWERLQARGKSLLSLLTSQATPATTNGLRYGHFSQANQAYQNIKPFDVLLSHAFHKQETSTSTQFNFGAAQPPATEKSMSTRAAVCSGGSPTRHAVPPVGMVKISPWTPPKSSAFTPASPSAAAIMTLSNGNSTLRRLLGHEIQPLLLNTEEEELKEKKTKLPIASSNKHENSVKVFKAEDEQQRPYIDPRLTCILRANLSEPLNRQRSHPMPPCELTRKRPAPVHLIPNPTTCGFVKTKYKRTFLGPPKTAEELAKASSHAHAHLVADSQPSRLHLNNAIYRSPIPSTVSHTPQHSSRHSTLLNGMKFGIVTPNGMTVTPAATTTMEPSSARRSEHAREENGPVGQADTVVPSGSNEAELQRDGMAGATEQNSRVNDGHVMLVTIATTLSNKPAGQQQDNSQAMAKGKDRLTELTSPEEAAVVPLTTPLVNLENIQPATISQLRQAGVSAMALLMSNGAIVGIPVVSLDHLQVSLPAWERLFLSSSEDGGGQVFCTSSRAGRSPADDDPHVG